MERMVQEKSSDLQNASGRPELKTDPKFNSVKARYANVREYFSIRGEGLKQKTSAEWLDILEKSDVPAGIVHSIDTLPQDEHLADVGLFRKVEHPVEGTKYELNNPNKFSAGLRDEQTPAPYLGADSVAILSELGYPKAEIDEMVTSKITADGRR